MCSTSNRLLIIQYFICTVFLFLCIASFGFADVPIDSLSGDVLVDMLENPDEDDNEFGEFDEFDEFDDHDILEIYDPISGYNRFMTQANDAILIWFVKPVALTYSFIIGEPLRQSIANFFDNLRFPVRFVNNLLQLKFNQTGTEISRFGVNMTIGVLGFFDPARSWLELYPCPEDFGQTLGYYGVGRGFHIVLPLLGPSNLRDAIGKVPDYFLDPVFYSRQKQEIRYAAYGLKLVNMASLHIDEYEMLKKDALDLYILLRNAYEIKRLKEIEE
jgi:phospholipid-binding lipoprotein MlaA